MGDCRRFAPTAECSFNPTTIFAGRFHWNRYRSFVCADLPGMQPAETATLVTNPQKKRSFTRFTATATCILPYLECRVRQIAWPEVSHADSDGFPLLSPWVYGSRPGDFGALILRKFVSIRSHRQTDFPAVSPLDSS